MPAETSPAIAGRFLLRLGFRDNFIDTQASLRNVGGFFVYERAIDGMVYMAVLETVFCRFKSCIAHQFYGKWTSLVKLRALDARYRGFESLLSDQVWL